MHLKPDLVFENARLVDGSGSPARKADVAIRGDRVERVSERLSDEFKGAAVERVDLRGKVLAPGFIDIHAHGELEPLADDSAAGKVTSGVTTEISGNCGCTPFPLFGELRERWKREAREVFKWQSEHLNWIDMDEYLERLSAKGCAINRGFLVGHGSIRAAVHGYADTPLDSSDQAQMRREVERALDAGAFGLSSGLAYPPGCYAGAEELVDLARICSERGALYTTHMRSEGDRLEESIEESLMVARYSGARTQISHLKADQRRNWDKVRFLEKRLFEARASGLDVHADRYPYVASCTGLDSLLPRWTWAGGNKEELQRIRSNRVWTRIAQEILSTNPEKEYWQCVIVAATVDEKLGQAVAGKSIAQIAAEWGLSELEAVRRILIEDELRTTATYHSMSEENLETILGWEFVMIASDATARHVEGPTRLAHPHPRTFGTFPRVLARYVRDKKLMSLEEAIHRMTGLPARTFGLRGRGVVEEGAFADLVVFDPEVIRDEATFEQPNRLSSGLERVYVNGCQVVRNGALLGSRPGRVLRHEGI